MPPSLCEVTGTLYDASGEPVAGVDVTILRVVKDGVVVSDEGVSFPTDEDGTVTFNILRGSRAWIYAPAVGWNVFGGREVVIPDAASATLAELQDPTDEDESGTAGVYLALLSQTGTDAPVATVLRNTLGGEVVWTRHSEGDYRGTLAGAFTTNTIFSPVVNNHGGGAPSNITAGRFDADTIRVLPDSGDGGLIDALLSVRVYSE